MTRFTGKVIAGLIGFGLWTSRIAVWPRARARL